MFSVDPNAVKKKNTLNINANGERSESARALASLYKIISVDPRIAKLRRKTLKFGAKSLKSILSSDWIMTTLYW